jgi:Integrase core domain
MMERLMKTLKVEGVYPLAFETADDVAGQHPGFIERYNSKRLHSAPGYLSAVQYEEQHTRYPVKTAAWTLSAPMGPPHPGDFTASVLTIRAYLVESSLFQTRSMISAMP